MKNLGKILAVVIALSMLLSVVGFAAFSDVKDTDSAAEAITVAAGLGLINGYPDGTFGAEKSITRAEFAAVVDRAKAMGDSADAAKGATSFTDVAADHWASGYINLAAQQGIINGMGDGTFAPEANVTFAQAVKMIVASLGYTPQATSLGGWPSGYLAVAAQKGVTKGVSASKESEPATRGTVVKMLYNSLDIPMMEQTGFGTDVKYEAGDKLLLDGLDVIKVEGVVASTRYSSGSTTIKNDQVKFNADKQYIGDAGKLVTITPADSRADISSQETVYVGTTNAKDLLDYAVVAYIKDVDNDPIFAAIAPKSGKNETLTIKSTDLKYADYNSTTGEVGYYTDKDNSKDDKVTIEGNTVSTSSNKAVVYYYNGTTASNKRPTTPVVEGTPQTLFQNAMANSNLEGTVVLLNNDTDDNYDVVYVTEYKDYIVDDVNAKSYKVSQTIPVTSSIVFDMENKDYDISFMKDGKPAKFEDIKKGNVLSVCGIMSGDTNELEYGKVIITDANVEGKVTEQNTTDKEVKIGDKTYEYTTAVNATKVEAGDEGKFYVNADGKIVAVDSVFTTAGTKLAYVTKVAKNTGISSSYQVRALLSTGEWKTFDVADKVNANEGGVVSADTADWATITGVALNPVDNVYPVVKVASYDVDSNGKINKLDFIADAIALRNDSNFFSKNLLGTDKYSDSSKKISSGIFVNEKSVLVNVAGTKEDDITVVSADSLIDGTMYDGTAYNLSDNDEATLIVGTKFAGVINYTNKFMVVDTKSTTLNSDQTEVAKLSGYVGADKVELMVKDTIDTSAVVKGTVFAFTKNVKGEIDKIDILFQSNGITANNTIPAMTTFQKTTGTDTFDYVLGYAFDQKSSRYTLTTNEGGATVVGEYTFATGAAVAEYDEFYGTAGRVRAVDPSYIEIDNDIHDGTANANAVKGDYVFAKVDDSGRIVEAVVIKHKS